MNKIVILLLFISNYALSQSCTSSSVYATWQAPTVEGQAGELTTSDVQTSQSIIMEGIVQSCEYVFSTCGTGANTALTGYNGSTPVFYNSENGPFCFGTVASIQWVATYSGNIEVLICGTSSGVNCEFIVQLVGCSSVGINDKIQQDDYFRLFPNPVSEVLNFLSSSKYTDVQIAITNFQGQLVHSVASDNGVVKIDFKDAPSGLYFYSISSSNQIIQTGKFIKH